MDNYSLVLRTRKEIRDNISVECIDYYGILKTTENIGKAIIDNPYNKNDDELVQILGVVENKIVGIVFYYPTEIKYGEKIFNASTGSYIYIHPNYRYNTGMAIEMIEYSYKPNASLFVAGGLSDVAVKMHVLLGGKEFKIPRFLLLVRSNTYLQSKFKSENIFYQITTSTLNFILKVQQQYIKTYTYLKTSKFTTEEVSEVPDDIDQIISNSKLKIQENHTKKWFEWALKSSFYVDPTFKKNLFLIKEVSGKPVAFFMTQVRFYEDLKGLKKTVVGSLVEWEKYNFSRITYSDIILIAVKYLIKTTDVIEISTTDSTMQKTLRVMGFVRYGNRNMIVNTANKRIRCDFDFLYKIDEWRIRPAFCDTIMY